MLKKQLNKFCNLVWTSKNHYVAQQIICNRYHRSSATFSLKLNLNVDGVSLDKFIQDLSRQYAANNTTKLKAVASILDSRNAIIKQIENLNELLSDKDADIVALALEEKTSYMHSLKGLENTLLDAVLDAVVCSENEVKGASMILEVNSGVGGQEAMLFASELFAMYINFIEYKAWDHYVVEQQCSDLGGLRHGSIIIYNADAFEQLQYEAGVHRVQRVPATERGGRIHTSTVSVLALPQPTDIQVHIHPRDLRIETKRATGAGGQHVNTTDSAVRIVHVPSGLAVECQTDRSQIRNKQIALERLRAKLYDNQLQAQLAQTQTIKSTQVISNDRNQKIRTYNYSQDRITDHRLQQTAIAANMGNVYNMKAFMVGGGQHLEHLISKIMVRVKYDRLLKAVRDRKSVV